MCSFLNFTTTSELTAKKDKKNVIKAFPEVRGCDLDVSLNDHWTDYYIKDDDGNNCNGKLVSEKSYIYMSSYLSDGQRCSLFVKKNLIPRYLCGKSYVKSAILANL